MGEFEPTFSNKDIKRAWEEIKYLSEKLIIKLDFQSSYIGGMLNAIASDFTENNKTQNHNHD